MNSWTLCIKIDLSPQVLLDVPIEHSSVYRMVIRYTNPNPEPVIGEVSVVRSVGEGDANPQTHQVSFFTCIVFSTF